MEHRKRIAFALGMVILAAMLIVGIGQPMSGHAATRTYYARVLSISGAVVASPLEAASIEWTEAVHVPGQDNLGAFAIALHDTNDPRYIRLRSVYDDLTYEQRVEIYDRADVLGTPLFTGVITALPSDLGRDAISGTGILRRLDTRTLRRYHQLEGTADAVVKELLKTYDVLESDAFPSDIGNWTVAGDNPSAVTWSNGMLRRGSPTDGVLPGTTVDSNTSYTADQWHKVKFSFDMNVSGLQTGSTWFVGYFPYLNASSYVNFTFGNSPTAPEEMGITAYTSGATVGETAARTLVVDPNSWIHIDVYSDFCDFGSRRVIIVVNGIEAVNKVFTGFTEHAGTFRFVPFGGSDTNPFYFDNYVFAPATSALSAGEIPASATAIDQIMNGDSQYAALNWVADYADYEYRVNPGRGKGSDTLDFAPTVGADYSADVVLEEGENIYELQRDRTSDGLATSLMVYGQTQDDASANTIVNDLAAFATYGIIEGDYSDPRVEDVATARLLGQNHLALAGAGNVSLSGTIKDEWFLYQQTPIWGAALWGGAVWGGRPLLRAGDYVWLKSKRLNIDKRVRIVAATRQSGSDALALTFDYFPYRMTDGFKLLKNRLALLHRAFINRMNAQNQAIATAGAATATAWYVYLRGQIQVVYLDVSLVSGAGTMYLSIDGLDEATVTAALGGPWTASFHVKDRTYLVNSGEHYLTFRFDAAMRVNAIVHTRVLS